MGKPHGRNLRVGRYSGSHQIYLLTLVTVSRQAVFADFHVARVATRMLHEASVKRHAATLAHVVMPEHVHWLMQLEEGGKLREAVRCYKARVSLALGRSVWQRGFHDHALRQDEDLRSVARYVVANPLRAGLVGSIGDYPNWDAIWL